MKPTLLYTIGYQMRTIEEFIALLSKEEVFTVVDVRQIAWSRKPGFSKKALGDSLGGAEIIYLHAPFAGNPKKLWDLGGTQQEIIDRYRAHLDAHPEIVEELHALIMKFSKPGWSVALTCYERHPDDCHRSVLADALAERYGYFVDHLGPDGCARAEGKSVPSAEAEARLSFR